MPRGVGLTSMAKWNTSMRVTEARSDASSIA
jgi:hypothetical protein